MRPPPPPGGGKQEKVSPSMSYSSNSSSNASLEKTGILSTQMTSTLLKRWFREIRRPKNSMTSEKTRADKLVQTLKSSQSSFPLMLNFLGLIDPLFNPPRLDLRYRYAAFL